MTSWLLSAAAGVAIAVVGYGWRRGRATPLRGMLLLLRAAALTLVFALAFNAPAGARLVPRSIVALDASASWTRGGDTARWRRAVVVARSLASDSLVLFGDSVRAVSRAPAYPADNATRVRPLVERALAAGRPLTLVTDGEIDDPGARAAFPGGSRVDVLAHPSAIDVGVVQLDAPRAVVSGDTLDVRVAVRAGALATPAGTLAIEVNGRTLATASLAPFAARSDRTQTIRTPFSGAAGPAVLSAIVHVPGDIEPRNDTLSVPVDVARAAGAVLASTSPDFDARFLLPVLRGAVALPTRAYFRVAAQQWRQDGSLAPVSERVVRDALRDAPLAIIHGDTSYFGAPRSVTTGSLALLVPPADSTGEWYAVAAPASPLSGALGGIDWDSLPPITTSLHAPAGQWSGLLVARAREFERQPVIVGTASGRRVVIVSASGLWRWQFRGGASADAFAAVWGSIFDWLTAERPDPRAAFPAEGVVRAGEAIRWHRGSGSDSVVVVRLERRGTTRADSIRLRFARDANVAESDPLAAGIYDVRVNGGSAVLVVNASRELLPRAARVASGVVGGAAEPGARPGLREYWWAYLLALALLCTEWILRRVRGLR